MPTTHRLKTLPAYFDAVERGDKTFELRINDRGFQAGDTLELVRLPPRGAPPPPDAAVAPTLTRTVSYVLPGGQWGLEPTYCVLGLAYTAAQVLPPPASGPVKLPDGHTLVDSAQLARVTAELRVWRELVALFDPDHAPFPPPALRDLVTHIAARAVAIRAAKS